LQAMTHRRCVGRERRAHVLRSQSGEKDAAPSRKCHPREHRSEPGRQGGAGSRVPSAGPLHSTTPSIVYHFSCHPFRRCARAPSFMYSFRVARQGHGRNITNVVPLSALPRRSCPDRAPKYYVSSDVARSLWTRIGRLPVPASVGSTAGPR
jgi:hypothetical protein